MSARGDGYMLMNVDAFIAEPEDQSRPHGLIGSAPDFVSRRAALERPTHLDPSAAILPAHAAVPLN